MTVALSIATFVLLSCTACGNGSNDVAASPSGASGCDFVNKLKLPTPKPGATPEPLTDAQIEEVARETPEEIRADLRLILRTARDVNEQSGKVRNLPAAERQRRARELFALTQRPAYVQAFRRYADYLRRHCRGFGRPSPSGP